MVSCASLHVDSFVQMWYQFIPATELWSQYPWPSGKMHALTPIPNTSSQVHVLPDMKCDGGSVSRLMPFSLQEGVCWSEAPLCCTKGPYMAKPCSPVLITSSTLQPKERFQWSPVRLCMMTALGKRGISSYQPLNFYHSTHSLVVKCMLWLPHLTHHCRSMSSLTWSVMVAQCPDWCL